MIRREMLFFIVKTRKQNHYVRRMDYVNKKEARKRRTSITSRSHHAPLTVRILLCPCWLSPSSACRLPARVTSAFCLLPAADCATMASDCLHLLPANASHATSTTCTHTHMVRHTEGRDMDGQDIGGQDIGGGDIGDQDIWDQDIGGRQFWWVNI